MKIKKHYNQDKYWGLKSIDLSKHKAKRLPTFLVSYKFIIKSSSYHMRSILYSSFEKIEEAFEKLQKLFLYLYKESKITGSMKRRQFIKSVGMSSSRTGHKRSLWRRRSGKRTDITRFWCPMGILNHLKMSFLMKDWW